MPVTTAAGGEGSLMFGVGETGTDPCPSRRVEEDTLVGAAKRALCATDTHSGSPAFAYRSGTKVPCLASAAQGNPSHALSSRPTPARRKLLPSSIIRAAGPLVRDLDLGQADRPPPPAPNRSAWRPLFSVKAVESCCLTGPCHQQLGVNRRQSRSTRGTGTCRGEGAPTHTRVQGERGVAFSPTTDCKHGPGRPAS